MSKIIIATFLMMGAAFLIGFAVAYLIKIISLTLNYFEKFSLPENVVARKRLHNIQKIRHEYFKRSWKVLQKESKSELLDYYYQPNDENENYNLQDNEIIRHYYGKY